MSRPTYKFIYNLVKRITNVNTSNNCAFNYYGYKVILQSGTVDYVSVDLYDRNGRYFANFSFDFWTKELDMQTNDERLSNVIEKAFKKLYRGVKVIYDDSDC